MPCIFQPKCEKILPIVLLLVLGGPIGESTWSYAINLNWNDTESNIINYTTSGQTVGLSLTKQLSLF